MAAEIVEMRREVLDLLLSSRRHAMYDDESAYHETDYESQEQYILESLVLQTSKYDHDV